MTAQRAGGAIVEERELAIRPFALVGFVADGEVENLAAVRDGVLHQGAQMRRAGAEARHRAAVIAGQNVVVAPVQHQAEIRRRQRFADVEAADMGHAARPRLGGDIAEERLVTGPREDVGHAHAHEGLVLLLKQRIEDGADFGVRLRRRRSNWPQSFEPLQLRAVAPTRRRRALVAVELLPVGAELGEIGAARIGQHRQRHERIGLLADRLRHLVERHHVEAEVRFGRDEPADRLPQRREPAGRHGFTEGLGEQRAVVIAQVARQPAQAADAMRAPDRQRKQEERLAALVTSGHDHRLDARRCADMTHPGRAPAIGLEGGAVALALELPPECLDRGRIAVDLQRDAIHHRGRRRLLARESRRCARMHENVGLVGARSPGRPPVMRCGIGPSFGRHATTD